MNACTCGSWNAQKHGPVLCAWCKEHNPLPESELCGTGDVERVLDRTGDPYSCPIRDPSTARDAIALKDEHGPLVWYDGCGSHRIAIAPRFARALGMDDTLTED